MTKTKGKTLNIFKAVNKSVYISRSIINRNLDVGDEVGLGVCFLATAFDDI